MNADDIKSAEVMASELERGELISLKLELGAAFSLIATLQLACRHPSFIGATRVIAEQFARDLQMKVAEGRPECAKMLERGWDKFFDE